MNTSYIFKVGSAVLISVIFQGAVFAGQGGSKASKQVAPDQTHFDQKIERKVNALLTTENVISELIKFQKNNSGGFEALIKLYNEVKKKGGVDFSSISPDMLIGLLPPEVLEWMKANNLLDENNQINPMVFQALDLTYGIITGGIAAAKGKSCKLWCSSCWKANAPGFISLTADLILPILANIAIGQLTKKGLSEELAVKAVFSAEEVRLTIEDKYLLKALKRLRSGLELSRKEVAAIILSSDAQLLSWTNIIKNLEKQIKAAIKASQK